MILPLLILFSIDSTRGLLPPAPYHFQVIHQFHSLSHPSFLFSHNQIKFSFVVYLVNRLLLSQHATRHLQLVLTSTLRMTNLRSRPSLFSSLFSFLTHKSHLKGHYTCVDESSFHRTNPNSQVKSLTYS